MKKIVCIILLIGALSSCVREIETITKLENLTPEQNQLIQYFDSVSDSRTAEEIQQIKKQHDKENTQMLHEFKMRGIKSKLNNYK